MNNEEKIKHLWRQWVCFKLGHEEFGVDILKVREIVRIQSITHVPQTPVTIAGVINLRGNVIPVIDLPKKLNLTASKLDDKARIIVFFVKDKLIGMIVDRVERVLKLRENQIESPPDLGMGKIQEYIIGMGKIDKDLIIQLNIEKILTEEEIIQIKEFQKIRQATLENMATAAQTKTENIEITTKDSEVKKRKSAPTAKTTPVLKKSKKTDGRKK